ncbi:MAG: TatD family hydrolase, partial [Clostridia bacterium]|nr:TatD family hydrolase [Clostridia bacterium]
GVDNSEALAAVPRESVVFETDAPYMAAVPFRGKPNQPSLVNLVVDKAAEVLGVERDILVEESTQNAKTLFNRLKLH